jgi:hypothetical protein
MLDVEKGLHNGSEINTKEVTKNQNYVITMKLINNLGVYGRIGNFFFDLRSFYNRRYDEFR